MNDRWQTKRLKLHLWEPEQDAIAAHQIYGDPAVMQFTSVQGYTPFIERDFDMINKKFEI